MLRDFYNLFILDTWRIDILPHLQDLWRSKAFWGLAIVLVLIYLIFRSVRKR